jgi:hypothetical protein
VLDGDGEEKEESCEPLDDQVQGPEIGCFGALKPQCSLDRLKIFRLLPRQTQKFPPVPFISPCPSYPVPFTPLSLALGLPLLAATPGRASAVALRQFFVGPLRRW